MPRTRIKICGLTRPADVEAAVEAGADAIGLVFYPPSPRYVPTELATELAALVPPFVTTVGLFVNPDATWVHSVLDKVPLQLLQFHGDEAEVECGGYGRPWIKAARMQDGIDLVEFCSLHPGASGILLDAFVDGYGGGGKVFDWRLIPQGLERRIILSGGLDPDNVTEAVRRVRPWAVDVSTGVESGKGIKDAARIAAFVAGVRHADG